MFENKVLRKIFGLREIKLQENGESYIMHTLYSSPNIIRSLKSRRLKWAVHVAHMGQSSNAYRVLVEKPESKRSLGRPRKKCLFRKIFGANRDEITGEWRKLHNVALHTLYSSPNRVRNLKSRRLR